MYRPLVIYHGGCHDGFCAAWLFWHAWPSADFHPANYGEPPPDVTGREVYIVDFSYKRPVMIELTQKAKKLVCLDHHKTAAEELVNLSAGSDDGLIRFDMGKSGGRLAWEYLGEGTVNNPPWIVNYTEDRDLWRWKLPKSKEINAALRSYPMDFEVWDTLDVDFCPNGMDLVPEGEAILRREQQIVDTHVGHAREIEMAGHKVLCVNATTMVSEICGELAKDRPFGCCYFDRADGKRIWSLRSRSDGGVDVSEIAKSKGGGGHKNAAGFEESI